MHVRSFDRQRAYGPAARHGVDFVPDILLLRFDAEHLAELATLAEYFVGAHPPSWSSARPRQCGRDTPLAVRSGARDILFEPVRNRGSHRLPRSRRVRAASPFESRRRHDQSP